MKKNTYISNEKIFYKNLITTLKTIRNEKGLTQEYVAKSIDIS
jgi:DNA-binding XRE family transcriptional regulator